jgi:hypothetical protein
MWLGLQTQLYIIILVIVSRLYIVVKTIEEYFQETLVEYIYSIIVY